MENQNYRFDEIQICKLITYRFKFTELIMEQISYFAKLHQYDTRKDFNKAWKEWIDTNNELIQTEIIRLQDLGYNGNIITKMYKSARYYFKNKNNENNVSPKKRRQYISTNKIFLQEIDKHIQHNIMNNDYKPKTGFIDFCQNNPNIVKEFLNECINQDITDVEIIKNKIKKTYKNRYNTFKGKIILKENLLTN
jgi:hypothetical protein